MPVDYLPYELRRPDTQYRERLATILNEGVRSQSFHKEDSVCVMAPNPLHYDLRNGVPLITERSMKGIWKSAFAELIGFLNGLRYNKDLMAFGVNEKFWGPFVTEHKCRIFGYEEGDLGEGSYGPGFVRQMPDGSVVNQMERVLHQIKTMPHVRTHFIDPWIPQYCVPAPGETRQVVVAPCHGWMHFRVLNGRLDLVMTQRSADMPVGVPSNIFQYAALLVVVAHVLKMPVGTYHHMFSDSHIYEHAEIENDEEGNSVNITQREAVDMMFQREPRPFPTLTLTDDAPDNLFDFRPHHLVLTEYEPHPAIRGIEVAI
jgi:thymidylate synthase